MSGKKSSKFERLRAFLAGFLVFIGIFTGVGSAALQANEVYAISNNENTVLTSPSDSEDNNISDERTAEENAESDENTSTTAETNNTTTTTDNKSKGDTCKDSLGALGWLVCPATGAIAKGVDFLYNLINDFLVINPIPTDDGTPVYEIWKYCRGVTNVVFIIFLLIVVYSQITGIGISNYGIKKSLPKLIVAAILVNLSFIICLLAVDASNIIGNSLRGLFNSVQETVLANNSIEVGAASYTGMYSAIAGGTALAIGGAAIAFDAGAIWMLIPTALGALVAAVTGLITIALRQAVVVLLIMIAPLAMVANILPNTEKWFKKWKDLLTKMLVFYPMFSLLFGASSLAGFAIMMSAKSGWGLLLGTAVQIFPLFFSWSLMKMSGTFLGDINSKVRGLAARPLATNRAWAESHRALTQKNNMDKKAYTPSLKLMQFMTDQKTIREAKTSKYAESVRNRGLAKYSLSHYNKDGSISKFGEQEYEMQKRNIRYQQAINMDANNFNRGLSGFNSGYKSTIAKMKKDFDTSSGVFSREIVGSTSEERLKNLDDATVKASDSLKMELARGAKIEYENAKGFHDRISNAVNAHVDLEAINSGNVRHQLHNVLGDSDNIERYRNMVRIMEGKAIDTNFISADAAHSFKAQSQIVRGKFEDLFSYTAPTQDVVNLLSELTKNKDSKNYIDPIVAGLRTLNMRGDTDLIRKQMENIFADGKVDLGTYASQSMANFVMFDVKGKDPFLRRFGKYINLETAKMYNEADPEDRRTRKDISFYEYVNGEYIDHDEDGNVIYDENGQPSIRKVRRGAKTLLKGTSFKDIERTAIDNMNQAIRENSVDISLDENGDEVRTFNYEKFKNNQREIWNAIMPNVIGDQFSYLSGSEQIVALGKGLTGMNLKNHTFDWEGIFGKNLANSLTPEQKKDYVNFLNERTKIFLSGQVPSQIARTKTDILESVRHQYAFKDAMDNDAGFFRRASEHGFKMTDDEYKEFEQQHMDQIKREFVNSYKEDALKGFVKMHHKGYQGEAKDGLIQLLNPDELYQQYFGNSGNNNQSRRERRDMDDDEDDGMPVSIADGVGVDTGGPVYSEIRNRLEAIFDSYRGVDGLNVEEFWHEAKELLEESREIPSIETVFDEIENSLAQYTNVSELYAYLIRTLFGGFE